MVRSRFFLVLLAAWCSALAQDSGAINKRIAKLLDESPTVMRGRFGYQFEDVQTGEVLAQKDELNFFTPASNAKLYTTALAMVQLGPNYRFRTELRTSGNWAPGQTAIHDLELIGGGDPNLSGRVIPYAVDTKDGNFFAALEELADSLLAKGVHEVNGDVTGVATRYPGDLLPDGWTSDDSIYGYGAPVSALTFNDSAVMLAVTATEAGDLAQIDMQPAVNHFIVLNEVTTDASKETHIHVMRPPGSTEVVVWGSIGKGAQPWRQELGVEDPAKFAAEALIEVLRNKGIVVRGTAQSRYRELNDVHEQTFPANGIELAMHESATLWEIAQVINKVSQNLHAEMLLREVARTTRNSGTLQAGVEVRETFLNTIGITPDGTGYVLADGSGLARQDLITPASTVNLLRAMWNTPERDLWVQTLPIGGVDGSLQHRFRSIQGAERVHAKTGSLSHVNSLSGYLQTQKGRWLAFSILVNGTAGHAKDVHDFLDRLCGIFLAE